MVDRGQHPTLQLEVDGRQVEVADDGASLLDVLRTTLGLRSPKDGCSPQGQCGCCTVLVDGQPRVACVTPARRVAGRSITTRRRPRARGAEPLGRRLLCHRRQPVRLLHPRHHLPSRGPARQGHRAGRPRCRRAGAPRPPVPLHWLAHDPRRRGTPPSGSAPDAPRRDLVAAATRAGLEGGSPQAVGPQVALGHGGFADDTAPADALVAVPDGRGGWAVGDTLAEARAIAGKVQGRRTTVEARPPLALPAGRLERRSPDLVGRARVPRAGRLLVRAGRRALHAAGQRRGLRRQGREHRHRHRPRARRPARPRGPGAARPGGRGAVRPEAATGGRWRRRAGPRGAAGRTHAGDRRGRSHPSPDTWSSRRSTSPGSPHRSTSERPVGPRRPCCSPAPRGPQGPSPTR